MYNYAVIYRIFNIRSSVARVASVMVIRPILMPGSFTGLSFFAAILVNLCILLPVSAAESIIALSKVLLPHLFTCSAVLPMFIFPVSIQSRLRNFGLLVVSDIHTLVLPIWVKLAMLRFLTVIFKRSVMLMDNKTLSKIAVIAIVGIVIWFNLPVDVSALFSFGGVL